MKLISVMAALLMTANVLPVAWCDESRTAPDRLVLEITVGECEPVLRDRLPKTTSARLSRDDLQQHNPASPILTQRLVLPAKGRLSQELRCVEFTIHVDLEYLRIVEKNEVHGGVSSGYASGNGLRRQSHWNCFSVKSGEPLYMGYVEANRTVYLIIGRFQPIQPDSTEHKEQP